MSEAEMSEELKPCREAFEKWYVDTYECDPYIHYQPEWKKQSKYTTGAQMEFDVWQAAWNTRATDATLREVRDTLEYINELWEKEEGLRKEERICKELNWDSPVLVAHRKIHASLTKIDKLIGGE